MSFLTKFYALIAAQILNKLWKSIKKITKIAKLCYKMLNFSPHIPEYQEKIFFFSKDYKLQSF